LTRWAKLKLAEIDFYLVTDSGLSKKGALSDVDNAIKAGCKIIQYREKNKSTREMIDEARKIKKICDDKAIFLINDRVDVALAIDADGMHLGQEDMPIEIARKLLGNDKIIGLTVHNVEESAEAEKKGADYIGLSPIFATATKEDAGKACGTEMINRVRRKISIPLIAIGGIDKNNVSEIIKAGADSAVAISAVVSKDNVYDEVRDFTRIIKENKDKGK
jgi:thiamine-phosphate pyrophosphorylase